MKSIRDLLRGIGCLLVAIVSFLLGNYWGFMIIPCIIAFFIGCIFLIIGIITNN